MTTKRDPLDDDELDELLEAAGDRDLEHEFTVRMLAHTGMRADELAHMRADWMDFQGPAVDVPAREGEWTPKTPAAERHIPIRDPHTVRVAREFFSRNEAVGVDRSTIYRRVKRVASDAGLKKKIVPHSLRHTYATRLAAKGATVAYIKQTMGHAGFEAARDYVRLSGRQLAEEADRLAEEGGL